MERFRNNQRVRIVRPDIPSLSGFTGTVHRLLMRDESAWIRTDQSLPESIAQFQDGDERRNDVNLFPDECEPL